MGKTPIDVVLCFFYIHKATQVGTFVTFYCFVAGWHSPFEDGVHDWLSSISRFQWVSLFNGILIGQGTNIAVYRAIGKTGVYYGHRLGHEVPWVTGFPFNVFPHAQYLGVCVFIVGVNVWSATYTHVAAGWFNLTLLQVVLYGGMALVEDYL